MDWSIHSIWFQLHVNLFWFVIYGLVSPYLREIQVNLIKLKSWKIHASSVHVLHFIFLKNQNFGKRICKLDTYVFLLNFRRWNTLHVFFPPFLFKLNKFVPLFPVCILTTYFRAPLAPRSCFNSSSTTFLFLLNTKFPKNLAHPLCELILM